MKVQRKNWFTWLTVLITLAPFLESFCQGVKVVAEESKNEVQLYDVNQVGSSKLKYEVKGDEIQWDLEVTKNQEDTNSSFTFTADGKVLSLKDVLQDGKNSPSSVKENVLSENVPGWSVGLHHITFITKWTEEVTVKPSLRTQNNGAIVDLLKESPAIKITLPKGKTENTTTFSSEKNTTTSTSAINEKAVVKNKAFKAKTSKGTTSKDREVPTRTAVDITTLPNASKLYDSAEGKTIFSKVIVKKNGHVLKPNEVLQNGDNVSLEYDWNLPKDLRKEMKAGDFFIFDLPERFKLANEATLTGNLSNESGEIFGTFSVVKKENSSQYQVKIVFDKGIEGNSEISGKFHIGGTVQELGSDQPGKNESIIPFVDQNHQTIFPVESVKKSDISKQVEGTVIKPQAGEKFGYVNWTIAINSQFYPLTNATVRDQLPAGVTFEDLTSVERISKDGTSVTPHGITVDSSNEKQPVFAIPNSSDKYILHVKTKVDFSKSPFNHNPNSTITNQAFLKTDTSGEISTKATTNFGFKGTLTKKVTDHTDKLAAIKKGVLPWTLSYKGDPLPAGTTFVETLSNGQVFSDENGNIIADKDLGAYFTKKSGQKVEVTKSGNRYTLTFTEGIHSDFEFDYYTKITKEFDSSENVTYSNTVSWNNQNPSPSYEYNAHSLKKTAGSYDIASKTASWKVAFKVGSEPLKKGTILTDTMDQGQKLLSEKKWRGT